MALSSDLLSQLVKATANSSEKKTANTGSTVRGTIVMTDGVAYVKLDGSESTTPVVTTSEVNDGDRVLVEIKDHTATVIGNYSSPSVGTSGATVNTLNTSIGEFKILVAKKADIETLDAQEGRIDKLYSAIGAIDELTSESLTVTSKLTATDAAIENLKTTTLTTTAADAKYATIDNLNASNAKIYNLEATYVSTKELTASEAAIDEVITSKISAVNATIEGLNSKYATIDFSNIGEAAIQKVFVESGIIKDLIMSDGNVTGELVGVTIKGDLIEAGTLKADTLLVKGVNGLYYRLNVTENGDATVTEKYTAEELQNGLLGSIIIAKSITAEKIAVDDLVAFDATIGGFAITEDSIHSNAKSGADNTTPGVYMDSSGQFAVGDSSNYIRFAKDEDGDFKLSLRLANDKVGARNLIRNSDTLIFDEYYFANAVGEEASVLGVAELGVMTLGLDDEDSGIATVSETEIVEEEGTSDDYAHQGFVDGMTLHDYHLVRMENAIIKALNGVATARITTISLPAANWSGSGTIYSQAVTVDDVTANSKVDLLPSPEQLNELLLAEISLTAANSDGSITIFAIGAAPSSDLELQAMITEVITPEVSS